MDRPNGTTPFVKKHDVRRLGASGVVVRAGCGADKDGCGVF